MNRCWIAIAVESCFRRIVSYAPVVFIPMSMTRSTFRSFAHVKFIYPSVLSVFFLIFRLDDAFLFWLFLVVSYTVRMKRIIKTKTPWAVVRSTCQHYITEGQSNPELQRVSMYVSMCL